MAPRKSAGTTPDVTVPPIVGRLREAIGTEPVPAAVGLQAVTDVVRRATGREFAELVAALRHPDPHVCHLAAVALGQVSRGDARRIRAALPALRDAARDPREQVALHAALSLDRLGGASEKQEALSAVLRALGDEDWERRLLHALAVVESGFPAPADTLTSVFVDALRNRESAASRVRGAAGLACLGPAAAGALPRLLEAAEEWPDDRDLSLHVASAVGQIAPHAPDVRALLHRLRRLARDDDVALIFVTETALDEGGSDATATLAPDRVARICPTPHFVGEAVGNRLYCELKYSISPEPSTAGTRRQEALTPTDAVTRAELVRDRRAAAFLAYREETRREVGTLLQSLAGVALAELPQKESVVDAIRDSLRQALLFVVCPRCGQAAMIDCNATGRSRTGWFVFRHGAKTHGHSGKRFPRLTLVDAPPKGTRKPRKKKSGLDAV